MIDREFCVALFGLTVRYSKTIEGHFWEMGLIADSLGECMPRDVSKHMHFHFSYFQFWAFRNRKELS